MKKTTVFLLAIATCSFTAFAQIDKDKLALEVSKVDAENTEKLKAYIWKFHAVVLGEGGNKTTLISEFQYDKKGDLIITAVGGETNIDRKPGVRGIAQQNAMESKLAYVSNAMKYSLAYTYMTKGQLLDFFDKAQVAEKDGVIIAKGGDVYVKGDQLTIRIDAKSKYFLSKTFSSKLGEDSINGEVQYEAFKSSGVNHISTTRLEMLVEKITLDGENKDYTIRVE